MHTALIFESGEVLHYSGYKFRHMAHKLGQVCNRSLDDLCGKVRSGTHHYLTTECKVPSNVEQLNRSLVAYNPSKLQLYSDPRKFPVELYISRIYFVMA
jgi:hypothetical protein